ncbi:hypothetical protein BDA96_08G202300 [Sorghum bicolor]|uniref:Pentatricopeptide repeat-containing protein n=1 Tax=Sorghum bicolor TaxID=4558 RepID=A0A921U8S0_SORBI|nr:hypothetical protein BDA96_08G202300 [Sorghum bicolor]
MVISSIRLLSTPLANPPPLPTMVQSIDSPDPHPLLTAMLLSAADCLRGVFLRKPPRPHRSQLGTVLYRPWHCPGALTRGSCYVVNAGDLGGAATITFFDWAVTNSKPPPSFHTYNIVIRALGSNHALQIMRRNIFLDLTTLEIIVDSLVAARHVSSAVEVLSTDQFGFGIGKDFHRKEALTVLIRCLFWRSRVGIASSLLHSSQKELLGLDNHVYNDVMGGWARFGSADKLQEVWTKMQEDGLGFSRAGRTDNVLRVFENMAHESYGPTMMAYNALILNFISVGDLDIIAPPNIDSYSKMIKAFLKGVLQNTGVITSFINPLCTFGPPHAALMLYRKIRKAGCVISLKPYKLLLERLGKFGKSGTVLDISEEMQECGYQPDKEITSLFNKLLEMDKVETAYNLFKKVKDTPLTNAWNYCRANGWHS